MLDQNLQGNESQLSAILIAQQGAAEPPHQPLPRNGPPNFQSKPRLDGQLEGTSSDEQLLTLEQKNKMPNKSPLPTGMSPVISLQPLRFGPAAGLDVRPEKKTMHITKWIILPFMATLAHAVDSIGFYAVTQTQIGGSQHVTISSLGVDGFSTEKPGYTITMVKQAFLLPPGPVTIIDQDGTPKGKRHDRTFNLNVTLPASEQKAFSEFSRQCLGGKILIKIGKEPILATSLFGTIDNGQFTLTLDSKEKAERLLKEFKRVEQAADGKTPAAPQPPN